MFYRKILFQYLYLIHCVALRFFVNIQLFQCENCFKFHYCFQCSGLIYGNTMILSAQLRVLIQVCVSQKPR